MIFNSCESLWDYSLQDFVLNEIVQGIRFENKLQHLVFDSFLISLFFSFIVNV